MIRICFQNGPDAAETILDEESFETDGEAKKRLDSIVHAYGTVPEAIGWLEGEKKPKFGAFADLFAASAEPGPIAGETPTSDAPEPLNPSDVPDRLPDPPPDSDFANAEVNATDAAKELADEKGVDLSQVVGTGENGRIGKPDVEKFLDSQ